PLGFRVVRREQFDHALLLAACERGVVAHQGEGVTNLVRVGVEVTVITGLGTERAKMVIAADGANSVIAQRLGLVRSDRISRLIEVITPANAKEAREFREHMAVFDFRPRAKGVQGYYWDFPCLIEGKPAMN